MPAIQNPLIVQSNRSLLLEVDNPLFKEARDAIGVFAHLDKSPEYIHTYTITPLSLWNAAALGLQSGAVIARLDRYSKYPLPQNITQDIAELMDRFGKLLLITRDGRLILESTDKDLLPNLGANSRVRTYIRQHLDAMHVEIAPEHRGIIKQVFLNLGYPIHDRAGYVDGAPFDLDLRPTYGNNKTFTIREYQKQAAESYYGAASNEGGSGVVVLPCGSGKTIIGIYVMSLVKRRTLILVTNIVAARQWRREILDKTTILDSDIGEYSGETKEIKPVTIATYQILTYRKRKTAEFEHFGVFNAENWGLIIYDEVHLLPAPVFQFTANIQARRRLGLTATLVREDGHEQDVFTLIGPKKFDVPWKDLERQGWIATARCVEIRIDLPVEDRLRFLSLEPAQQIRQAYENPLKIPVVKRLIAQHPDDRILVLGQYITQLEEFSRSLNAPLIMGATPNAERERLFAAFRSGEIRLLIISKVGNFAIDLPDATVAIQISGAFGSRQEEAQRLGRILRPKQNGSQAVFYSVVTRETRELDFAMKRQLFLTEQGYTYEIRNVQEEPCPL